MMPELTHILCIDDEEDILEILAMSLEEVGGFRVTRSASGADGIKQIEQVKPDLILLDVMMPIMDGLSTLAKIRENGARGNIPVIFMTARIRAEDIKKYLSLGAADVIEKPFDPMGVSDQIMSIWRKLQSE